jgi:hypothetical protein
MFQRTLKEVHIVELMATDFVFVDSQRNDVVAIISRWMLSGKR